MTDPIQLARECGFDPLTPDGSFYTAGEYQITALISRVREEAIRECVDAVRALLDQSGAGEG